jgi:Xaa-Pro dipeptidase
MFMRIRKLTESVERAGFDAYIVTREWSIVYYTGSISGGVLIVTPKSEPLLLAPSLNITVARDQATGLEVQPYTSSSLTGDICGILRERGCSSIGFDDFSLNMYKGVGDALENAMIEAAPDLVWEMRKVKDPDEQKRMMRAGELADIGMEAIREFIEDGVREHEVAAEASYAMRREGAEDIAFPFIVVSGPRSAYPHGGVTDRRIGSGELVTVDMGAAYQEYKTDITRTFIIGQPTEKQIEIYEAVLESNRMALPRFVDGAAGVEVDRAARDVIDEAGYGEYFIHGLGHGLGLEIHEPPSLSKRSKDTLRTGNVVSNEPGIYIPGFGGVRIEDTVLVDGQSPRRFTGFPRELNAVRV